MQGVFDLIKQICGPSKVPGGNKPQMYFLLGSWAFFGALGLLIPSDILDHAWAREFTDFIAAIVPQIDRIAALKLKPDVNRFHYSVLWSVSPIYLIIAISSMNANIVSGAHKLNYIQSLLSLIFGLYIFLFSMFLWYGFGSVKADDPQTVFLFYNDIIRSFWAPLFAFVPSFFAGGIFVILKNMITGHLFKEKRGHPHGG